MDGNLVFDISCSRFTEYTSDGFVNVQVDADGDGATVPAFEAHHPYGFISRPRDPTVDANGENPVGCNVLYAWEGDRGHAWFLSDPRVAARLPLKVEPGGSMMYADRDDGQLSIQRMRATDGSWVVYVPGKDGKKQGSYITLAPDGGLDISTPYGRQKNGPDGLSMTHISGASISMGSIGGLPAPLNALTSFVDIAAASVNISGSIVSLGIDGGVASQAALTGLAVLLLQVIDAIAAITTVTPGLAALSAVGLEAPIVAALHAPPPDPTGLVSLLSPIGKIT